MQARCVDSHTATDTASVQARQRACNEPSAASQVDGSSCIDHLTASAKNPCSPHPFLAYAPLDDSHANYGDLSGASTTASAQARQRPLNAPSTASGLNDVDILASLPPSDGIPLSPPPPPSAPHEISFLCDLHVCGSDWRGLARPYFGDWARLPYGFTVTLSCSRSAGGMCRVGKMTVSGLEA